jgi:hypothetical protein
MPIPASNQAVNSLESILAEKNAEVETLQNELTRVNEVEATKRSELQQHIEELERELAEIKNNQSAIPAASVDNAEMQATINQLQEQLSVQGNNYNALQEQANASAQRVTELEGAVERANQEKADLLSQIQALQQSLTDAASDNNVTPEEVADLQNQIAALKQNAENEATSYRNEINRLQDELTDQNIRVNSLYEEQEKNRQVHEQEINEYREQITNYTEEINRLELESSGDMVQVSKLGYYDGYASISRAILVEEFRQDEMQEIAGLSFDNFSVFSFGPDISLYKTLQDFKKSIFDTGTNALVVDCTCDACLSSLLGVDNAHIQRNADLLEKETVASLVVNINGVEYIPCDAIHDVSMLALNWGIVIRKLYDYAQGKPVIILLGNVASFVHRLLSSKMGCLNNIQNCLFVTSEPFSLRNTISYMSYYPSDRVNLLLKGESVSMQSLISFLKSNYGATVLQGNIDFRQLII